MRPGTSLHALAALIGLAVLSGCMDTAGETPSTSATAAAAPSATPADPTNKPVVDIPNPNGAEIVQSAPDEIAVLARAINTNPQTPRVPIVAACHAAQFAEANGFVGIRLSGTGGLRRVPVEGQAGALDELGEFQYKLLSEVSGTQVTAAETVGKCRNEWGVL